jgi:hypothetical protein
MDSNVSVVSVRLQMPDLHKLQALARVEGSTVGSLIRDAVAAYLEHRLGQPELQRKIEAARAQYDDILAQLRPRIEDDGPEVHRKDFARSSARQLAATTGTSGRPVTAVASISKGRLAASGGKLRRPTEQGRVFLDRGRHQFKINGDTTIEVQERDRRLLVRWIEGPAVRIVSDGIQLDQTFREFPSSSGRDLIAILLNGLELVA